MTPPLLIAYGGGVNSTALLVELHRRGHRPDLILFADTGGERPETIATVATVSDWGVARGFPPIVTVRYRSETHGDETLEENCLRTKSLPSIAYGFKSCSEKFKIRPQNRYTDEWEPARQAWAAGLKVRKAIGYDAGEQRRAKIAADTKYDFWYPLIEWGLDRDDCWDICHREGLPTAKSSCFFCPSMRKPEVLQLAQEHPDLLARALRLEANAELTTVKGLGRHWNWHALTTADANQLRMFSDPSPEIPCGCYDG